MCPRPRVFSEQWRPEEIARAYSEGRSTRELEKMLGVSRWCVTATCLGHGVPMRSRDEALGRRRWFDSLEAEERDRVACCWPRCADVATVGHLCEAHVVRAGGWLRRGCVWPGCGQQQAYGTPDRLQGFCWYHSKRARGLI